MRQHRFFTAPVMLFEFETTPTLKALEPADVD
jgi:hypothetical protein